jgi:cytochrome c-type biogenesis protein CcmF
VVHGRTKHLVLEVFGLGPCRKCFACALDNFCSRRTFNAGKQKQKQFFGSHLHFIFLTFLLVLYSTYLTRSGILGETSVHSFAEGMPGQLIVFMSTFILIAVYLLIKNYKSIPKIRQEESLWSREFWMFIGALILGIAAFQISFSTSIPVTNKVFGTNMAPPEDAISHYNSWQIPFTIIVCLLIAFAQYLKYKNSDKQKFFKQIALSLM